MDKKTSKKAEELLAGIQKLDKNQKNINLHIPNIYYNQNVVELDSQASRKETESIQVGAISTLNNKRVEAYFADIDSKLSDEKGSLLVNDVYKEAVEKGVIYPNEFNRFTDSQIFGYGIIAKLLFDHVFDDGKPGLKLNLTSMSKYKTIKDITQQGFFLPKFKTGNAKLEGSATKNNITMKFVKVTEDSFDKFFLEQDKMIASAPISRNQQNMLAKASSMLKHNLWQMSLSPRQRMTNEAVILSCVLDAISDLYDVYFPGLQQVNTKNPQAVLQNQNAVSNSSILPTSPISVARAIGQKNITEIELLVSHASNHGVVTTLTQNGDLSVKVQINKNAPTTDVSLNVTTQDANGNVTKTPTHKLPR